MVYQASIGAESLIRAKVRVKVRQGVGLPTTQIYIAKNLKKKLIQIRLLLYSLFICSLNISAKNSRLAKNATNDYPRSSSICEYRPQHFF